jgi:shikimate kinase
MSQLVVITGPIASGKSVVATALADRLDDEGLSAVVVDLDDIVATVRAPLAPSDQTWGWAREIHGRLVGHWLTSGVDAVIAHGPFYSAYETSALMQHVPTNITARRVMLLATYEVARDRVASDPSRGHSKDPTFLKSTYERFFHLLPDAEPCEWTFDTTQCTVSDVVTPIAEALLKR